MGALREPKLLKFSHIEKISEVSDELCLEVRIPQNMVLYSKSATTLLSNPCYNCIDIEVQR